VAAVESLDLEGQGVAHRADGKVVFIEGALPGEQVRVNVARRKNQWEQGQMSAIRRESSQRVQPGCPHFGLHAGACGGCKVQHLHATAQVAAKQRVLEDNLSHLAKVVPQRILRPLQGPAWGYRSVRGCRCAMWRRKAPCWSAFHERKSRYVADMTVCPVLPPRVSALLPKLRELIGSMDARDRLPQIEVAVGDDVSALVLRHLEPLSAGDAAKLRVFGAEHRVQWWLQPGGPDSAVPLDVNGDELNYRLPEFDLTMPFRPTEFTQVNMGINRVLVSQALRYLDAQAGDR
jgi:23S rRNA (uracil1939-C5)-methyltransferase